VDGIPAEGKYFLCNYYAFRRNSVHGNPWFFIFIFLACIKMLIGQDNTLQVYSEKEYSVLIRNIHMKIEDVMISEGVYTDILAIKHHKKYKVVTRLLLENGKHVDIGQDTILHVVEEHDRPRLIPAKNIQHGHIICPPIPSYADIRTWAATYGVGVKTRQLILAKVSTIIFDKCEYVPINGVPILHDNHEDKNIRKLAKRSNSLARLILG